LKTEKPRPRDEAQARIKELISQGKKAHMELSDPNRFVVVIEE
jgi:hypothetical protein